MPSSRSTWVVATLGAALFVPFHASSVVVWDESSNGDLSGNRNLPTGITLGAGSNEIIATTQGGDLEYVTFQVPNGFELANLFVRSYTSADQRAFLGMQTGTVITEDPALPNPANLLGYSHFGPGAGNVGDDILPAMGTAVDAIGFIPPLAANSYSLWIQQLGQVANYRLDLVMAPVPEPVSTCLCAGGLLATAWFARRRGAADRQA